jgi:hypothetical protein
MFGFSFREALGSVEGDGSEKEADEVRVQSTVELRTKFHLLYTNACMP